ncbi:MAG: hypothetical protein IJB41_07335 [Clostridia bacterium]|nr:hypothetical protein [Clostridia bacterium]
MMRIFILLYLLLFMPQRCLSGSARRLLVYTGADQRSGTQRARAHWHPAKDANDPTFIWISAAAACGGRACRPFAKAGDPNP